MTKEALKLALEALEDLGMKHYESTGEVLYKETFTAIKEALAQPEPWEKFCDSNCVWTDHHPDCKLAQPEQEPVAWVSTTELLVMRGNALGGAKDWRINLGLVKQDGDVGLYTTPPQRKPLTDEEIGAILEGVNAYGTRLYTFARAIEAAHGIKGEA